MKKIIIAFSLLLSVTMTFAQQNNKEYLPLSVWIPDNIEGMPKAAKNNLENKLNQIIVANGVSGKVKNSQFIITANVVVQTKDILPTAPPMQAYTLEITLYIGDGVEGKSYASYSTTVKGVGENETKAYMAALKQIKTTDPNYQAFIDKGKSKIIDYYTSHCDKIISEAKSLATQNKFDEAIWKLTSVPDACTPCWNKCVTAIAPIFQQQIDYTCKQKLAEANNAWNTTQDYDAAERAAAILKEIDPKASCFNEAKLLGSKISKKIQEANNREFKLELAEVENDKALINAYRDIGVAYANSMAETFSYVIFW